MFRFGSRRRRVAVGLMVVATVVLSACVRTVVRESVDSAENEANDDSEGIPTASGNGRFVAFRSEASNLVADDTNEVTDVFVRDNVAGTTVRISVDSAGQEANAASDLPAISDDGRFVTFRSTASNLVEGDTNGRADVFLRDTQLGLTTRVSVDSTGNQGLTDSNGAAISTDGQYVAFMSAAPNLVAADTNDTNDVFVHDRTTGLTTRASVDSTGVQGNDGSVWPNISGTGRYVTFVSYATNLVADDTNGLGDVFVHDTSSGKTTRVNVDAAHNQANGITGWPVISRDGVYVVFYSHATNLVPADSNGAGDFFRVTRW